MSESDKELNIGYIDHNGRMTTKMIYNGQNPHGKEKIRESLLVLLQEKSPLDTQNITISIGEGWGDDIESLVDDYMAEIGESNIIREKIEDDCMVEELTGTEVFVLESQSLSNSDIFESEVSSFTSLSQGIDYLQDKLNNYDPRSPFTKEDTIECIFNAMVRILIPLIPKTEEEQIAINMIISQASFAHDTSPKAREELLVELSGNLSNFYDVLGVTVKEFFKLYVKNNTFEQEQEEENQLNYYPEDNLVDYSLHLPLWYIVFLYLESFGDVDLNPSEYYKTLSQQELINLLQQSAGSQGTLNHDRYMLLDGNRVNVGG